MYTGGCLSHSTTLGKDWSPCSNATGLNGTLSQLIIKDSKTMFMLRLVNMKRVISVTRELQVLNCFLHKITD